MQKAKPLNLNISDISEHFADIKKVKKKSNEDEEGKNSSKKVEQVNLIMDDKRHQALSISAGKLITIKKISYERMRNMII